MGAEIQLQPAEDAKPEKVMFKENCMYEYPLNQAPGRIYGLMEREAHPEAGFKAGLVTPGGGSIQDYTVPEGCVLGRDQHC